MRIRLFFFLLTAFLSLTAMSQDRTKAWSEAEKALENDQPQTAFKLLKKIERSAIADEQWGEASKAILLGTIQEHGNKNHTPFLALAMDKKVKEAHPQLKPILRTLSASFFCQYYSNNRWKLLNRSETTDSESDDDPSTWSASRLLKEIDARLQLALEEAEILKTVPVPAFSDILEKGELGDQFRPTLYDFIAHQALTFYRLEENNSSLPVDTFEFAPDSPALDPVEKFLSWQLEADQSSKARALNLLQELLRFHKNDEDQTAFNHCNLLRIEWASEASNHDSEKERYLAALTHFTETYQNDVNRARAQILLGSHFLSKDETLKAYELFSRAFQDFPDHPYGKLAKFEKEQMETKWLRLRTETHWANPDEIIKADYRNLDHVWFRLYSIPYPTDTSLNQSELLELLKGRQPVREWEEELEDPGDYKDHSQTCTIPTEEPFPIGYHFLVATSSKELTATNEMLAFAPVHITTIALTARSAKGGGIDGIVVDALTGEPLKGIKVTATENKRNNKSRSATKVSNENGYFAFPSFTSSTRILATRGLERATARTYPRGQSINTNTYEQAIIFTDRAIYRPGQTIHFKAICTSYNQATNKYKTSSKKKFVVTFFDTNQKEINKIELVSNKYGSASGTFVAPEGINLGQFSIIAGGKNISGHKWIRIEEYKRPKFFSTVIPPTEEAALDQEVTVTARAESYNGSTVNGAKVSWKVTRMVRWPYWRRWSPWASNMHSSSEEIAHGIGETDEQGNCTITFTAKPDNKIDLEQDPTFNYLVSVDITDPTGETRSTSHTISLSYTAFQAAIETKSWLTTNEPVSISIRTNSNNGQARAATGTLKIHELISPESCQRTEAARSSKNSPNNWEIGELVSKFAIETKQTTEESASETIEHKLPAGNYRLIFESKDSNGQTISSYRTIEVLNLESERYQTKIPFHVVTKDSNLVAGDELQLFWGSGFSTARALIEVYQDNTLLHREWTPERKTQHLFRLPVTEKQAGGFYVSVIQINQNRLSHTSQRIEVPWSQKALKLSWERIVDKLEPGAKETWTAVIEGPNGEATAAEMVATLYDASLDAFLPHSFATLDHMLRRENGYSQRMTFCSSWGSFREKSGFPRPEYHQLRYPFRRFIENQGFVIHSSGGSGGGSGGATLYFASDAFAPEEADKAEGSFFEAGVAAPQALRAKTGRSAPGSPPPSTSNQEGAAAEAPIPVRTNLQETAFFYPDLTTEEDGKVHISFTIPEALTQWRFLGFAHDNQLRSGSLEGSTVTALDLMIQPNPPRFLREGDIVEFTAKVSNQSDETQKGTASLFLENAATGEGRNAALSLSEKSISFEVPAQQSQTVSWRIEVPNGEEFLRYKVTASTSDLSDGEEGWLPVLSRRVLITESKALPIRDAGSKDFQFNNLLKSAETESIENRFLHLQVVSQPAWYGLMSLPYLMEFPHECAEQTFSRYYANALGRKIITSDPKLKKVFELWKKGDSLDSPLSKNEDLKGLMLQETPWLAEAENQTEARKRVAFFFEENRINRELEKAFKKLTEMQGTDGLWPWFPGGKGNPYISLHIVTGFARLREMEVPTDITPALKALSAIDSEVVRKHNLLRKHDRLEQENLSPWIAHYLYTRTLFLSEKAIDSQTRPAYDYYINQAEAHWTSLPRFSRGQAALALHRLEKDKTAKLITRSLRENAIIDEEFGMYWDDTPGWYWWQAPIESQALMIEAFREIEQDQQAVSDCQVWLIKNKQTNSWNSTKATTEAVASLFLNDSQLLSSDALLEISLAGEKVEPGKVEPGTGFYQQRFSGEAVTPEQGNITLTKSDSGVSWASVHWQYLVNLEEVIADDGDELQLEKQLFVKKNTDSGPILEPVSGPLAIGDELVTRLVLRNDRDMEYVHLKDQRGSGTEPVNVLSGYRWSQGLGYYESTRDTASHFYIDHLPAGTHVFETSVRVQLRGTYQTGIAEIRCMYAPEFAAHSKSLPIIVK